MKKWTLLYFLLLANLGFSQDWSGMYPGATHFYSVDGYNNIYKIHQDSAHQNGSEINYFPELAYRDVYSENIVDANCQFFSGPQCFFKKDEPTLLGNKIKVGLNSITYFDLDNDSIFIRFDINVGDTQIVYNKNNHIIKYKLINIDSVTIFSQADSIMQFLVIHQDSLYNLVSSQIQGDTIIYTKNLGLIKGYAFKYFPESFTPISIEGIRNPNYGFYGLTYADIYDYQVGDQFETFLGNSINLDRHLFTVLSRNDNSTSVNYSMYDQSAIAYPPYPPSPNYIFSSTTINKTYSKLDYVDDDFNLNSYYYKNGTGIFNCWSGTTFRYYVNDCDYAYCPTSNCYGGADCFGYYFYEGEYGKKIGLINETITLNGFGTQSDFYLLYSNIQQQECGSSFILSTNEIESNFQINIFPNPANELLTIQSDRIIENGKIILTDLSGREISHQNLNQSNSHQIDISNFSSGIYLLKICSGNTVLKLEKLLIEK